MDRAPNGAQVSAVIIVQGVFKDVQAHIFGTQKIPEGIYAQTSELVDIMSQVRILSSVPNPYKKRLKQ
jgi:hypothetical protein